MSLTKQQSQRRTYLPELRWFGEWTDDRVRATSRHLQPAHRAFAGREFVGRKTQALEHGEVEIGERVIICGVKGQMLAVLETAAREHHGQVHVRVRIRAAHRRAV